jgi:hypothetical protein
MSARGEQHPTLTVVNGVKGARGTHSQCHWVGPTTATSAVAGDSTPVATKHGGGSGPRRNSSTYHQIGRGWSYSNGQKVPRRTVGVEQPDSAGNFAGGEQKRRRVRELDRFGVAGRRSSNGVAGCALREAANLTDTRP